jgi:predicted alpha/beta-hydrolase family hydrolase
MVSVAAALAGRPALLGYLRAGSFSREMALEPDGGTLLVGNYGSDQLEAVSISGLPCLRSGQGHLREPARRPAAWPAREARRARADTLAGVELATSGGTALADIDASTSLTFLLVLTHGAGGGPDSADLLAARDAAMALGAVVARVTQPYRVRGGRAAGSPVRQDAAWLEIIAALRGAFPGIPLVQGGRSNGARVACRTARAAGARAVVALAFPLHPPGYPERSRLAELRAAGTDVLVVNGERDPFGAPDATDATRVVVLPGQAHSLSAARGAVRQAVQIWLGEVLRLGPGLPGPADR